ncbi:MAG TPA: hypothetical protein VGC42_24340, partial [Kofleriaceae bacterium]
MTGPIYLVSACASGEEFVAAFRRYADKHGLFVPISEPLPVGARARFAVTLKDGGVMLEGEAEVIASAKAPSVLHGRTGMTLRFHEPDEPSKILLGELAMARLAMRPAPPSVAPRPAEVPATPRPTPPAPAGRVDAVNALAECVVIGAIEGLGAAPAGAASASASGGASKASAKFAIPAVPSLPPGARKLGPATGSLPAIAVARTSTSQPVQPVQPVAKPIVPPPPEPIAPPPPVTGFSRTMSAVKPILPGPSSDTYVAAVPPPPESTDVAPRERIISTTISAIPLAASAVQSAPTDVGGVIVDPDTGPGAEPAAPVATSPEDDASSRTQVHAGAPRPVARPSDAIDLGKTLNSPPPDMAEIRAEIERRTAASRAAAQRPAIAAMPAVEVDEWTDLTDLPIDPDQLIVGNAGSPEGVLARAPRRTAIGVAVTPPTGVELAGADPDPASEPGSDANEPVIESLDAPGKSRNMVVPPTGEPPFDPAIGTPVEISLDASIDLAADDPALAGDEPTGVAESIIIAGEPGDPVVDVTAPTLPPDGTLSPFRRDAAKPEPAVAAKPEPAVAAKPEPAAAAKPEPAAAAKPKPAAAKPEPAAAAKPEPKPVAAAA